VTFEIIAEIGRGGMGVVYTARQVSLDRDVALKTLLPGLDVDESLIERFRNEARAASRTNHPDLVQIYDVGCQEATHYFAMELVKGESLAFLIRREGAMDYLGAAAMSSQVAAALGALHSAGIVHRDLKPSNILVRPDGLVKITDFGVALLHESSRQVTTAGATVGTADYMSPEQARGEALDGRSDIYSLGAVLYQMLAGHVPFSAKTPLAVMKKHCEEPPPSLRRACPDIPDRLAAVVLKCLAKDPAERYQTAEALAGDLDHLRLELEFAVLSAQTPAGDTPSVYSTRTVASLRRQRAAQKGFLRRCCARIAAFASSTWRYAIGTLDRDVVGLRRQAGRMENALSDLAQAKEKRADMRRKAAKLREQAAVARLKSGEAFDRDEVAHAEELVEEEKRCDRAAVDFETAAESLGETIVNLENRYKSARDEHERLQARVHLKQVQALQDSLDPARRRRHRHMIIALAASTLFLVICVIGGISLWRAWGPTRVTLKASYDAPYKGARTDKLSVQYAVIAICGQAGLGYNWDESYKNTNPLCRRWVTPEIVDTPWPKALRKILDPKGLTYDIVDNQVILRRKTARASATPPTTGSQGPDAD